MCTYGKTVAMHHVGEIHSHSVIIKNHKIVTGCHWRHVNRRKIIQRCKCRNNILVITITAYLQAPLICLQWAGPQLSIMSQFILWREHGTNVAVHQVKDRERFFYRCKKHNIWWIPIVDLSFAILFNWVVATYVCNVRVTTFILIYKHVIISDNLDYVIITRYSSWWGYCGMKWRVFASVCSGCFLDTSYALANFMQICLLPECVPNQARCGEIGQRLWLRLPTLHNVHPASRTNFCSFYSSFVESQAISASQNFWGFGTTMLYFCGSVS